MRSPFESHSFESFRVKRELTRAASNTARDPAAGADRVATGAIAAGASHVTSLLGFGLLAIAILFGAGSCERTRLTDGIASSDRCTACHGTPGNAAPPYGLDGQWHTTDLGVGAHQVHLIAGTIGANVPCQECHPIPADLLSHPNWSGLPTTVTFGGLASLSLPTSTTGVPIWDRATATCTNVYCHGATMADATQRTPPVWTRVDGSQKACNSCHGNPPKDSNHQTTMGCEACHGVVVGAGGVITNRARHVDGKVDLGGVP